MHFFDPQAEKSFFVYSFLETPLISSRHPCREHLHF